MSNVKIVRLLVDLYDVAASINDHLRRHDDHVTFEGSMNDCERFQETINEVSEIIMTQNLR